MRQIVIYFWQICLLRAGPQQLPQSLSVMLFLLAIYFLIAALAVAIVRPGGEIAAILGGAFLGILIEAVIVWLLLLYKRVSRRFTPTMSALLGTNAIIQLILLPMNVIMINAGDGSMVRLITELAWLACFGWWLAIAGFILHHAVYISILQGAALIFVVELLSLQATRLLFFPGG